MTRSPLHAVEDPADAALPVNKVVATAFSLTIGLADDRQIVFQSGFEGDETDAVVNERLDRIMRLGDRQKARYKIPQLEEELAKHRDTLAQFQEDLGRAEATHASQQATRQVELEERLRIRSAERKKAEEAMNADIAKIQQHREGEYADGLKDHQRGGRTGSYVPGGNRKTNLEKIDKALALAKEGRDLQLADWDAQYDAAIEAAKAEIAKADAEREQHVTNLNVSIKRYEAAIVEREEQLAVAKKAAGD